MFPKPLGCELLPLPPSSTDTSGLAVEFSAFLRLSLEFLSFSATSPGLLVLSPRTLRIGSWLFALECVEFESVTVFSSPSREAGLLDGVLKTPSEVVPLVPEWSASSSESGGLSPVDERSVLAPIPE